MTSSMVGVHYSILLTFQQMGWSSVHTCLPYSPNHTVDMIASICAKCGISAMVCSSKPQHSYKFEVSQFSFTTLKKTKTCTFLTKQAAALLASMSSCNS